MAEIKKLTDGQREALRLLGWAPNDFQQTVKDIVNKRTTKAFSTHKDKNAQFYARTGRVETIKEVVQKLTPPTIVWIPLGYCYFIRKAFCRNCQRPHETCLDCHMLYLVQTNKVGSTTRRYTPVDSVAHPALPRWTKEVPVETLYCLNCYGQAPAEPVPAPQAPASQETVSCSAE